jgi:hypothetical protein
MLKLSFRLPACLHRLMPVWLITDLERRSAFNGTARRSFALNRILTIDVQADQEHVGQERD